MNKGIFGQKHSRLISISAGALLFVFVFFAMAKITQVKAYARDINVSTLAEFETHMNSSLGSSNPAVLHIQNDITVNEELNVRNNRYLEITGPGKLIIEQTFWVEGSLKLINGGKILCKNNGYVIIERGATFEISGGVFEHDSSYQSFSIQPNYGTFKISGGELKIPTGVNKSPIKFVIGGEVMITGGTINHAGSQVLIASNRGVIMSGGTVNLTSAGLVSATTAGAFNMSGGTINYEGSGGAVLASGGSSTMTGGTINNKSTGSGVRIRLDGNFTISENAVINNTGTGNGVLLETGTFTMNGGTISNTAGGDAVNITGTGTFTKNSGTVTGKVEMGGIECCTVSFDKNGGSGSMPVQYVPKNTDTALIENKFTHETKSFYRWKDSGSDDYYKNKGTVNFGTDKTLVAQWADKHTITVTDDGNGTGSTDIDEAVKDETITVTATPDSNHVFKEWTSDDGVTFESATSATTTFEMLDKNVTVKANFKEKTTPVTDCTVSFNANGGKGTMADQSIPKGTPTGLSRCDFTYTDHTFAGWARTKNGEVEYTDREEVTLDMDSLTLYAKWTDKPATSHSVTVICNGSGNAKATPSKAEKGKKIVLTANPDDGNVFKEWKVISGNVRISDDSFTMPDEDVEVEAIFEEIPEGEHSITVTNDGNGTGIASKRSAAKDTKISLEASAFDGYKFDKWEVVSGDITINDDEFTMPDENVIIKACFVKKEDPKKNDDDDDDDDDVDHEDEPAPSNNKNTKVPDGCDELRSNLASAIALAASSGTEQTIKWDKGTSLPYDVMKMLQDNPKITLEFSYTYQDQKYKVTIPGSRVIANPSIQWYGPIYLYIMYGKNGAGSVPAQTPSATGTYTVESGDTLSGIAKRLNTTLKHLKDANNIKDADKIKPGMVLKY